MPYQGSHAQNARKNSTITGFQEPASFPSTVETNDDYIALTAV